MNGPPHSPDGPHPDALPPPPTAPPTAGVHHPAAASFGGYQGPPPTGDPGYAGHPAQAYPPQAYPFHYPVPAYPGAGYPYPYPPAYAYAAPRPGPATGAAVLGFINAGLLLLAGVLLLFGASLLHEVEKASGSDSRYPAELTFDGVVDLLAGTLLIIAGVMVIGRNPNGRIVYGVAAVVVVAAGVYWLLRFPDARSGLLFYDALFVGLAVIGLALSWTTDVSRWFSKRPGDNRI